MGTSIDSACIDYYNFNANGTDVPNRHNRIITKMKPLSQ